MSYDTLGVAPADILNQHGNINPVVNRCVNLVCLLAIAARGLGFFLFCCHIVSINARPQGFNMKDLLCQSFCIFLFDI